jgi:hypothetical protein
MPRRLAYCSPSLLLSTKIHHNSHTCLTNANAYIATFDTTDMSDFSLLLSKDSGSDQVQQSRRVGLRNGNNDKNNQKLSPQELFNQILRTIKGAKEHQFLTYEGVDPQTGSLVVDSLREDGEVERRRPR